MGDTDTQITKPTKVLVIGFGDSATYPNNMSKQVLAQLEAKFGAGNFEVVTRTLPITEVPSETQRDVRKLFEDVKPDVIITAGQLLSDPALQGQNRKPVIAYSATALNLFGDSQTLDANTAPGAARSANFSLGALPADRAPGAGRIMAELGNENLGQYLCNAVLFEAIRYAQQPGNERVVVTPFMHLLENQTGQDARPFVDYYTQNMKALVSQAVDVYEGRQPSLPVRIPDAAEADVDKAKSKAKDVLGALNNKPIPTSPDEPQSSTAQYAALRSQGLRNLG